MLRWFLGLAAVPAFVIFASYRYLPESPRYLNVVGKHEGADKVCGPGRLPLMVFQRYFIGPLKRVVKRVQHTPRPSTP